LSSSARAYQKYLDLNAELEEARRFSRSTLLHPDDESKDLTQKRIADIEKRSQAAKKEHEDAIVRLIEANTWPITKTQDRRTGNEEYKELVLCIAGLRDTITELHTAVNDLVAKRSTSNAQPQPSPLPVPPAPLPSRTSSSTTVINLDPRPRKKRRISTDDVDMVDISEASGKAQRIPPSYNANDLDHLNDKLSTLDSRLSDVENTLTQYDREITEELESKMDEKVAELRLVDKSSKHEHSSVNEAIIRKFEEAEQNLNVAGEEIGELAEAMASLYIQVDLQLNEIKQVKAENAQLKAERTTASTGFLRPFFNDSQFLRQVD
jgi:chromosome segregation ATPase